MLLEENATTDRYVRQSDLVDSKILSTPLTIIGAGAIGSFTTLTLAKMGFSNITVWDFDAVDLENISNQFYPMSSVGSQKVVALRDMIKSFEQVDINIFDGKCETGDLGYTNGIVISAVDSMNARHAIWDCVEKNKGIVGLLDGRMGGQQAEVYTTDLMNRIERGNYKRTLWSESEASTIRCTAKATMYNVLWIASTIANNTRLLLSNLQYKNMILMDFENMAMYTPERLNS